MIVHFFQIGGEKVRVRLRTIDWKRQIEKEINLTGLQSEGLYNPFTNSLLGEDFEEPALNYDMEGELSQLYVQGAIVVWLNAGFQSGSHSGLCVL